MKDELDILNNLLNSEKKNDSIPKNLTILPLRDNIIFPFMIFPILIGRTSSLKAVAEAVERDRYIFVAAQKNSQVEEPGYEDIYNYGTTAKIIQVLRLPNNLLKVLVEGLFVSRIKKKKKNDNYLEAEIEQVHIVYDEKDSELEALIRHSSDLFSKYIKDNQKLPTDLVSAFDNIDDPIRKLYFAAANINQKNDVKQQIIEKRSLKDQYFELSKVLSNEIDLLKIEDEIGQKVSTTIQKTQRKYFIQEQIRVLQNELGDDDDSMPEIQNLRALIEKAGMPDPVKSKVLDELEKLRKISTMSPEYSVNRTYIEWLAQVPWSEKTQDNFNIEHVKRILDEDHYDLEKPKERILEFIAILNLAGSLKKQILCFVGPPGVGKTSLGRSIARALGRKFVRFSLGGVRDEAEIRGHRRTYIGALPGKIIQSMKKAGTVNPVILLDEIDKMSMDFRGDPSSALLEVLDPEQNVSFNDHYLDVDYDLSNVLFITTANVRYEIPIPLQDRMEIIELSSYMEPEKLEIAKRHIIPKLKSEYALNTLNLQITDSAVEKLIREYTREAGVRNLEREIASILRKTVKELVHDFDNKYPIDESEIHQALKDNPKFQSIIKKKKILIDDKAVERLLKAPRFKQKQEDLDDKIGVATGLAWTSVGGEILPIEVTIMPGPERLTLTGKLGDVMKESARAALSYIRSNCGILNIDENFYKRKEIHIHIPEGAIPKDGPSAGITMTMAMISAAANRPVRGDVAMTGEVTLRGNILPIGGLNEKLLAAKRAGIKTVIIPRENERDIDEINDYIKNDLKIVSVKHITEALDYVFHETAVKKSGKPSAKKAK
jgi:ATP-dependent Lon protease